MAEPYLPGPVDAPSCHDILLAEDDPADLDLFRIALEESEVPGTLHVVTTWGR